MRWKEAEDRRMGTARPRARTWKTQRTGLKRRRSRNKERQRSTKGRVLLVRDALVRYIGRNFEQQCVRLDTMCKPGGRIEQMVLEIEKRGDKEEAVIVQVGTNNLRMDET